MKLTAKEREAIEKARKWAAGPVPYKEWDVSDYLNDHHPDYASEQQAMIHSYAMGYLAGQRDAKKGKGKK